MANDPDEMTPDVEETTAAETAAAIDDDPAIAEAEAIAEQVASSRPVRKTATDTKTKKGRATPKQKRTGASEEEKRTGPIEFVSQSVEELKKVNWPTLNQWQQYFWVVLVFVLFVITYISLLDLGIGAGLLAIFG
ncbi:MAG: preprotein translocase subunit SecE [Propionibacteriaceae bacterium]|nr:preprotein translocase subunit SecE [Propionibacteriaceae bacterium]